LNAPYQRTPVVFSLLDAAQDTQWVRINRTWLGDGNQLDAALVADSSEYLAEELAVEITEQKNGADVQSWTLKDTVISHRHIIFFIGAIFVTCGTVGAEIENQHGLTLFSRSVVTYQLGWMLNGH